MATKKAAEAKKEESALVVAGLNSSAMAVHATFDKSMFEGVGLDVLDNKDLFSNDIIIPKIWLIQAMSELRKQKKADEGQFVDSTSAEILCDNGETLRFVVLKTFKRWQTFKQVTENGKIKKEFVSSEIMVLGKNENLAYDEVLEGEQLFRRQVISAYVLLEKDVRHKLNKPYIIDFASSSKGAGRKMISDINTLNANGLPSFTGFFEMSSKEQKFDDGSAFVKDINFGGYMSKEVVPFLVDCYKNLKTIENMIQIDDRDVIEAEKSTAQKAETKVNGKALANDAGI